MYKLFVLSACEDTTNDPNMQVFRQKNAKNLSFSLHTHIYKEIIGADITIQAVGGKLTAKCLDKSDCKRIKELLMEYNKTSKTKHNIFS